MDKKGCGLLLMRNGAKSVFCGDEFWGKKRYCDKCSQIHGSRNTGHLQDITGHLSNTSKENKQ